MKTKLLAAAFAAGVAASLTAAAPASATIFFDFTPGASSPGGAGYTVINKFTDATGITGTGAGFEIKVPPSDGDGATPANSIPAGTSYLSVLGGGAATVTFAPVTSFEFDWGSVDTYNTLLILSSAGTATVIPGHPVNTITGDPNFDNVGNGDQHAAGTNGLFRVWSDAGETFSGITLESSSNSFEIDNLAVAAGVPEPAAWSLMIMGFGLAGGLLRAKRRTQAVA
jgi:hypothetical protein